MSDRARRGTAVGGIGAGLAVAAGIAALVFRGLLLWIGTCGEDDSLSPSRYQEICSDGEGLRTLLLAGALPVAVAIVLAFVAVSRRSPGLMIGAMLLALAGGALGFVLTPDA